METLEMHDAELFLTNAEVEEVASAGFGFHEGYLNDMAAFEGFHN